MQQYILEEINDKEFLKYPIPSPGHIKEYQYEVFCKDHTERIETDSKNLHNVSIKIENTGTQIIRKPYLYGPHGWDFRSFESLSPKVTENPENSSKLSNFEKFVRIHEFNSMCFIRFENQPAEGYDCDNYHKNPLRIINQYGGGMCGQSAHVVINMLRYIPPRGSFYGAACRIGGHVVGEAFFDGKWHNFDTSPNSRWIYYDLDNVSVKSWNELAVRDVFSRVQPWVGFSKYAAWIIYPPERPGHMKFSHYAEDCDIGAKWDFNYDLKPDESITMYFDMRGRVDKKSVSYVEKRKKVDMNCLINNNKFRFIDEYENYYRNPCDYGSAVFSYKPKLTNNIYRKYVLEESNVRQTINGLVPKDFTHPSYVVFGIKSTWTMVGAVIKALFKSEGKVYIAVSEITDKKSYPENREWILLEEGCVKDDLIEGRMAYLVKFEFEGKESGLDSVQIDTEVQMSPFSMPALEYGINNIRFTAENMKDCKARITYKYDDESPFDYYEPASGRYGRHISFRVGGVTGISELKGMYWKKINEDPERMVDVGVEITKVSGDNAGKKVRTLMDIDKTKLPLGTHKVFWDGRDDKGNKCPVGMYCYKITMKDGEEKIVTGERLYLFNEIWPVPNELKA